MAPQPVEVTRLIQAIEQFQARAPRNLPEGVMQQLTDIQRGLTEVAPEGESSPGLAAVQEAVGGGTDGTGVHYSKAARGPDKPSPGQREAWSVSQQIEEAASEIADRVRGGERVTPAGSGVSE